MYKNLFTTVETNDNSFTIKELSKDGNFVIFTNTKVTTVNHMKKLGPNLDWKSDDTFELPSGYRAFNDPKSGFTFFTDKAEQSITAASVIAQSGK